MTRKAKEFKSFLAAVLCGLALAGCQTLGQTACGGVGAALGSIIGGFLGSLGGKGSGRTASIVGGAAAGGGIGYAIGRYFDRNDQCMIGRALNESEDGRSTTWRNEQNGREYTLTPTRTYVSPDGRQCRDFVQEVLVDGRREKIPGKACKRANDTAWDAA